MTRGATTEDRTWHPAVVPRTRSLAAVREAAMGCQACELWANATQTVFGSGLRRARLMLVGEQPGDREDREGEPFVGPAGRLLDRAFSAAGIDRADVYITNVVKHFRNQPRGKRRIHQRPDRGHVEACRPWLEAELQLVRPEILVCLGALAAQSLIGPKVRVTTDRGRLLPCDLAERVTVTVHPSSILRIDDGAARAAAFEAFTADLRFATAP